MFIQVTSRTGIKSVNIHQISWLENNSTSNRCSICLNNGHVLDVNETQEEVRQLAEGRISQLTETPSVHERKIS